MDEAQESELRSGLPFSSSIAREVSDEAVFWYLEEDQRERDRKAAFEERRLHAFLTARWRCESEATARLCGWAWGSLHLTASPEWAAIPIAYRAAILAWKAKPAERPPAILCGWAWGSLPMTYQPPEERAILLETNEWVFEQVGIDVERCLQAGLSLNTVGVEPLHERRWLVKAWIPSELSSSRYRPIFREVLPLPEVNDYSDCSLTPREWLVVFAALADNPDNPKQSPVPRPPEDVDLVGWRSAIHQRMAFNNLILELNKATASDVKRFKTGRVIVIKELLRECFNRALQKVRSNTASPLDLIGFDGEKPSFFPIWSSPNWPATDTPAAIRQWLSCNSQVLAYWNASLDILSDRKDVVSITFARQACEDAAVLGQHLHDVHGIKNVPPRPADESLTAAKRYLDDFRQAISEPASGSLAGGNVPSAETEQDTKRTLTEPSREAFAAYQLYKIVGMNQVPIAEQLTKEFRRQISQGQVSRWVTEVGAFLEAGGVMPPMAIAINGIASVDPKILDMGARQDGQTPRQRFKSTSDDE